MAAVILLDARRAARERRREFDAAVAAEEARRAARERQDASPRRLQVVR